MSKLNFFKTNVGICFVVIIALLIGFFSGTEYKAYQIRSALLAAAQSISNTVATNSSLNQSNPTAPVDETIVDEMKRTKSVPVEKNIGDTVELAKLNIKVTGVEEGITSNYLTPITAQQGTKFSFITLNIVNSTKSTTSYTPDFPLIVDDQDRVYLPYNQSVGHVKNNLIWRSLSPGIPEEGVVMYQLPTTVEHYYILMGKGGTEEFYKIQLK